MRAPKRHAHKRPRLTLEHGPRQLNRDMSLKRENVAERTPDVSSATKMAMNSLLGRQKMTKKELYNTTTTDSQLACAAGTG